MPTRIFLLLGLILAFVAAPLRAADAKYLRAGQVDVIALFAPPSTPDFPEGRVELEATFAIHMGVAATQRARASDENKLIIVHFAPAIGPWFVPGRYPKTEALFKEVEAEAKAVTDEARKDYKCRRPYHFAPERFPHSIEHEDPTHYSYPSGHSTRGTVFAALLAELFPEERAALFAIGREVGWLPVIGGVHYPRMFMRGEYSARRWRASFCGARSSGPT